MYLLHYIFIKEHLYSMKKPKKLVMTRIGVMSTAKIYTAIMFISGLVLGIATATLGSVLYPDLSYGESLLLAVMFPFLYGILGFFMGAFSAIIYNFLAKYIGGIELEFRER